MKRRIFTQLFATGLLMGSLGAIACRQPTVEVNNPTPNDILISLVGTWQMEDRVTRELKPFKWIFSENGQLTYTNLPTDPSTFIGMYRIDSSQTPMHMDLQLPDDERLLLTIFEFTEEGDLKIRLGGIDSVHRPDGFTGGDTVLRKISDETNVESP